MSRLLSIFLSILVFGQTLNIGTEDFSKIDVLLKHAKFHQEKYGDNFFEFMIEHYAFGKQEHQPYHQEHKNLPFKHLDCSHVSSFIPLQMECYSLKNLEIPTSKPVFFYKEIGSLFEKASIFQPPKVS